MPGRALRDHRRLAGPARLRGRPACARSPVSAQTRVDDTLDRRVATVGRVHPHVEIKIVDPETGVTVPRGVRGELCTRGYSVMLGYWRQPGKTTEAIDAARWMHTGDLAAMDADG